MANSLTVFLCSTVFDLAEERKSVLSAIRKLRHQHDSMEYFGARPNLPIETCLEEVRKSDILITIVGHKYGSVVENLGISYSEAEYNEGYRLKKPCLVYLRDETVPVLPSYVEHDPEKIVLLEKFRSNLQARHTVAYFRSPSDLALSVAADLTRTVEALQEGVQRQDEDNPGLSIMVEVEELINSALEGGMDNATIMSAVRMAISEQTRSHLTRNPLAFLSYSHKDKSIVQKFANNLKKEGIDIWLDTERITGGASIIGTISRGLEEADVLIYFISANSSQSQWSTVEVNTMIANRLTSKGKGARVIPVVLDETEVPAILRDILYIDLTDGNVTKAAISAVNAIRYYYSNNR